VRLISAHVHEPERRVPTAINAPAVWARPRTCGGRRRSGASVGRYRFRAKGRRRAHGLRASRGRWRRKSTRDSGSASPPEDPARRGGSRTTCSTSLATGSTVIKGVDTHVRGKALELWVATDRARHDRFTGDRPIACILLTIIHVSWNRRPAERRQVDTVQRSPPGGARGKLSVRTKEPNVGRVNVRTSTRRVGSHRRATATVRRGRVRGHRGWSKAVTGRRTRQSILANIRETDGSCTSSRVRRHDVMHVMGTVDPVRDREVIEFEVAWPICPWWRSASTREAHVETATKITRRAPSLERRMPRWRGSALWHEKLSPDERAVLAPCSCSRSSPFSTRRTSPTRAGGPRGTTHHGAAPRDHVERRNMRVVPLREDRANSPSFRRLMSGVSRVARLKSAGLDRLDRGGVSLARTETYFTAVSWSSRVDDSWRRYRPVAAGVIHTDFGRVHPCETVSYETSCERRVEGRGKRGLRSEEGYVVKEAM